MSHTRLIEPPAHRKRPITAFGSGLCPPSLCRPRVADARCGPAPTVKLFKKPAREPPGRSVGNGQESREGARGRGVRATAGSAAQEAAGPERRSAPGPPPAANGSGPEGPPMIGWSDTSLKGLARTPLRSWVRGSGEGREGPLREQPRGRRQTLRGRARKAPAGRLRGTREPRRARTRRRKVPRTRGSPRPGRKPRRAGSRGLERRCGAGGGTKASAQAIGWRPGVARDAPRGRVRAPSAASLCGVLIGERRWRPWRPWWGSSVLGSPSGRQRAPSLPLPPLPRRRRRRPGRDSDEASATANGDGDAAECAGRGQGPGGRQHGELAALQAVHRRPQRADE